MCTALVAHLHMYTTICNGQSMLYNTAQLQCTVLLCLHSRMLIYCVCVFTQVYPSLAQNPRSLNSTPPSLAQRRSSLMLDSPCHTAWETSTVRNSSWRDWLHLLLSIRWYQGGCLSYQNMSEGEDLVCKMCMCDVYILIH